MSTAIDVRGLKRVCSECGIRFYDLNKRPITCPSCETEFTGEIKTKGRKGRAAIIEEEEKKAAAEKAAKDKEAKKAEEESQDEIEEEDDGIEEVSLDDVKATESANENESKGDDEVAALGDLDTDIDEDIEGDDDLDSTLPDDLDEDEDDLSDVVKVPAGDE